MCYLLTYILKIIGGPKLPKKIRALASYREYTFAAFGNDIAVFKRAHQVCQDDLFVLSLIVVFFSFFLSLGWFYRHYISQTAFFISSLLMLVILVLKNR